MAPKFLRKKKPKKIKRMTYMSRADALFKPEKRESKFQKILNDFCEFSKLNGLLYVGKRQTSPKEKYLTISLAIFY